MYPTTDLLQGPKIGARLIAGIKRVLKQTTVREKRTRAQV